MTPSPDFRPGTNGQFPDADESDIRTGYVDTLGNISTNDAVTCARLGVGTYLLTFSPPFKSTAHVTAMVGRIAGVRLVKQFGGTTATASNFQLATLDPTGALQDSDFWFTAQPQ